MFRRTVHQKDTAFETINIMAFEKGTTKENQKHSEYTQNPTLFLIFSHMVKISKTNHH